MRPWRHPSELSLGTPTAAVDALSARAPVTGHARAASAALAVLAIALAVGGTLAVGAAHLADGRVERPAPLGRQHSEFVIAGFDLTSPVSLAAGLGERLLVPASAPVAWMGVRVRDLTAVEAGEMGVGAGVLLVETVADTPAEEMGLVPGDVIVRAAGTEVTSLADLSAVLRWYEPGDRVRVGLHRAGVVEERWVTLASRPVG